MGSDLLSSRFTRSYVRADTKGQEHEGARARARTARVDARCTSVDQMRLINNLCRFVERAARVS